jgi:hypothetical protein
MGRIGCPETSVHNYYATLRNIPEERRVKRTGREVDHSSPSTGEVKNEWSYTSTPAVRLHIVDKDITFLPIVPF